MARRRMKKRTHSGRQAAVPVKPTGSNPKSMVIRIGASEVGSSVSQLVKDVRMVMEPNTAARLQERRNNKLRDYLTMTGPLGVTHLLLFSKSESGNTNLRLCTTPRGPTLSFRVEKYSLCKDVQKALKRPRGAEKEDYLNPPLLLMNNFQQTAPKDSEGSVKNPIPKQLEDLTTTVFRSMFPPITPQTIPLQSVKRVLLLDRVQSSSGSEDGPFKLQLRHYAITTRRTGLPKSLKRLSTTKETKSKKLPNLGKLDDVADYILDPSAAGYTSASDTELDTDAEVEVLATSTRKILSTRAKQRIQDGKSQSNGARDNVEKRAVKLLELGPRMTLRLVKIEEGLTGGKVLWHESITKTKAEEKEMEAVWETRRKEKEERRRIQKENVERKRKERGENVEGEDDDDEMADYDDDADWDDMDDEGEDVEAGDDVEDDDEEMEDEG